MLDNCFEPGMRVGLFGSLLLFNSLFGGSTVTNGFSALPTRKKKHYSHIQTQTHTYAHLPDIRWNEQASALGPHYKIFARCSCCWPGLSLFAVHPKRKRNEIGGECPTCVHTNDSSNKLLRD